MIPSAKEVAPEQLGSTLRSWLREEEHRLGLITSIDGRQLVTLLLNKRDASSSILWTQLDSNEYQSLTPGTPQAHWFERAIHDLFGLVPIGHPRLKPAVINEAFSNGTASLAPATGSTGISQPNGPDFSYLHVEGEGIFELPVGPVHAGVIEPGHFRLSCLGESVVNLEIRLGFLHRGVEKRLTQIPWTKARFVAEAAASDTTAANALAHAIAIESLVEVEIPARAQHFRTLALEIERLAMHIADVGGMAVDLGYLAVAAAASRLRGQALRLSDLLSGSRFLRGFISPGGVTYDPEKFLPELKSSNAELRRQLNPLLDYFLSHPSVYERLRGVGCLSPSLAKEFGVIGVAGRGSNVDYDVRSVFPHATFPKNAPKPSLDAQGDALSRTLVRAGEIVSSLDLIDAALDNLPSGDTKCTLPNNLPSNKTGLGVVEAFRGELIHLVFTDESGRINRYAIKDPSVNNWTGLAIAARNNVIADFPVCNKSFALAYSGHDL